MRFAGLITLANGVSVATRVFHIWYLPIIPLGTFRMTNENEGAPTNFSFLSLLAAYFKSWGFIAAVGLSAAALDAGRDGGFLPLVVAAAILFGLVYASWLFLGRAPNDRPSTGGYVVVGLLAVGSFGVLGYGVVDHRGSLTQSAFIGPIPKADSPVSALAMGVGQVRAIPASEKAELAEGELVEFEVPGGGYAHGVVASPAVASEKWVKIRAGRNMESLSVHRDALTILDGP